MDYIRLSKTISMALRHQPELYGLELDKQGWVDIAQLLYALRRHDSRWEMLQPADLEKMMAGSEKQRFEIAGDRIRAFYGHSVKEKIKKPESEPPAVLYHGTSAASLDAILRQGLLPMRRQYVHLSQDIETAQIVARRRKGSIAILEVQAAEAWRSGVKFYKELNGVWLSEPVPAQYLRLMENAG